MKTGAVVLAAGESQISNIPMLKRELDTLRDAGISPVAVVTGYQDEIVKKELAHRKVIFVHNGRFRTSGMIKSIQLGLTALQGKCGKAVIVPADVPSFNGSTLEEVISVPGEMVIPAYEGRTGHPVCIDMSCAESIIGYRGRNGMRGIMNKDMLEERIIEVDDPGILMEADSEKSYKDTVEYRDRKLRSHPVAAGVDVRLQRTRPFFDEELLKLLEVTESCGSMNQACKDLNMAYSRGWKMLKYAEEQLEFTLLEKHAGGRNGGGSGLTEKGRAYVDNYKKLCRQVEKYAEKRYLAIFEPGSRK